MYENVKAMLKDLIPPALLRISRKVIKSGVSFSGSFGTWEEAEKNSIGYDSDVIFEKTRNALLKVKSGEATHERDSVLFDEIQYSWPLLAGLMWVAARNGGVLNVMDFGGSFGSTYFQNKAFLRCLPSVRWNIVEQPKHVQAGKECFEDEHLRFYPTMKHCLAENEINVTVLGSVLQYIEHPFELLDELLRMRCDHAVIDRTPFWDGSADRLCVQTVSSRIYQASYPSWIFSIPRFHAYLGIRQFYPT